MTAGSTACAPSLADLSRADLGLAPADRAALRRMRFRAVVHSAAAVDHARPYDALRATNVAAVDALVAPPRRRRRRARRRRSSSSSRR